MIVIEIADRVQSELKSDRERLRALEWETERLDRLRRGGGVGLGKFLELSQQVETEKRVLEKLTSDKQSILDTIELLVESTDDLPLKVAYLKRIKKLSLLRIAGEIGYSYGYVRDLSSAANKRTKDSKRTVKRACV